MKSNTGRNIRPIHCYDCGQIGHVRRDCQANTKGKGAFLPEIIRRDANYRTNTTYPQHPVIERKILLAALNEAISKLPAMDIWGEQQSPCAYCGEPGHTIGPYCQQLDEFIQRRRLSQTDNSNKKPLGMIADVPGYTPPNTRQPAGLPINAISINGPPDCCMEEDGPFFTNASKNF